jgi:starch synthase
MGLEGIVLARSNRVHGILNGIDPAEWSPANDPHLAVRYGPAQLSRRTANKRALEKEFGLARDDGPLFVVVSRLTWQKGMDVLIEVLDHLVGIGGRLALLGSGDAAIEQGLHAAAARHPGRIGVRIGYDEALSHRMQGGGDAILVPSRFEPCGLTQLYGLAYGCVPVVSRTGGLADTVIDANPAALAAGAATGIQMNAVDPPALAAAVSRAVALYARPREWRRFQRNGMKADFSWTTSGAAYAALYRQLAGNTR